MPPNSPNPAASGPVDAEIYSVSRLNREARRLLETGLARIWIAGEISNLARPASGHIYFSLKDAKAQVRCAMFRSANRRLKFRPEDGSQVLVEAKVSIYEQRGDYQLIVERLEEAGEGALRRKFEELKARLDHEGLFDAALKQPLPSLPGTIGVVTSPTGAAIRDILNILRRRYPGARVIIYPTRVQGDGAADEIATAIATAAERDETDVLIVARGGGSLEDLWAFNEEVVARAIYACPLPVIAGVGHEVDVSIADLVADLRAPTPSGAAELVVPDRDELFRNLNALTRRAMLSLQRLTHTHQDLYRGLMHRLQLNHPGAVLGQTRQLADELSTRLAGALTDLLDERGQQISSLQLRLRNAVPEQRFAHLRELLELRQQRLLREMQQLLRGKQARFAAISSELHAVSPLATLERGYAIVTDSDGKTVLRDARDISPGDSVRARLAAGEIEATVSQVRKKV